jgi:Uma2 family endonuclease
MAVADVRLWTVDEYHQILEAGILNDEDSVELLAGKILQMSPQRPPHAATTQCASDYLRSLLKEKATVRVQSPITLPPNSEPEPDIAIVRVDSRHYLNRHPNAADIYLLIEVADRTLRRDCHKKAAAYARAGIADYWILNLNKQQLHIFRQPTGVKYQKQIILNREDTVSLLTFPQINIKVACLFPFETKA